MDQRPTSLKSIAPRGKFKTLEPWIFAFFAVATILGIVIIPLWLLGFFDTSEADPTTGAKTIAAALALVGAALTASITLIGIVVKYSIDDRTTKLAADAEQRNRIDVSIRAVGLLSENNQDATPSQMSGALLALSSLGEHDLAISLLQDLWAKRIIPIDVAELLITRAMNTAVENTQNLAAVVFWRNADQIYQPKGFFIWPLSGSFWDNKLPFTSRINLVRAAIIWLKSEIADPDADKGIPSAAFALFNALEDPSPLIRMMAASVLVPLGENYYSSQVLVSDYGRITMSEINQRLQPVLADPQAFELVAIQNSKNQAEIRALLREKWGDPTPPELDDDPT